MRYVCSYCLCEPRPPDDIECSGDPNARTDTICPVCLEVVKIDLDAGGDADPEDIRRIANYQLPACQRCAGI